MLKLFSPCIFKLFSQKIPDVVSDSLCLDISEEAGSLTGDCGDAGAWPQLRPEVRLICGVVIIIIPRNYEKTEEIYWFIYEVP